MDLTTKISVNPAGASASAAAGAATAAGAAGAATAGAAAVVAAVVVDAMARMIARNVSALYYTFCYLFSDAHPKPFFASSTSAGLPLPGRNASSNASFTGITIAVIAKGRGAFRRQRHSIAPLKDSGSIAPFEDSGSIAPFEDSGSIAPFEDSGTP
jgi:hypothetical protein